MTNKAYDVIVVGGGLGGASLAKALASNGLQLPRIVEDQTRAPDHLLSGLDLPANEEVRKRFFGED